MSTDLDTLYGEAYDYFYKMEQKWLEDFKADCLAKGLDPDEELELAMEEANAGCDLHRAALNRGQP